MEAKAFVSAFSKKPDWREAVDELSAIVKKGLAGRSCDLLIFFVSEPYEGLEPVSFVRALSDAVPSGTMIGCNSSGVIANDREVEMQHVAAKRLPGGAEEHGSAHEEREQSIERGSAKTGLQGACKDTRRFERS